MKLHEYQAKERLAAAGVPVQAGLVADKASQIPAILKKLGAKGRTLVVDVAFDEKFSRSARNIAGVSMVASGRLTARDVMNSVRVIATRAAVERLQEVLG